MKTIEGLQIELKALIKQHKEKPYLPVWGEIFSVLKEIRKLAKKNKVDLVFYQIQPMGLVRYDYKKKHFVVEIPDMNIHVKDDELIDSILKGRFSPKD